MTTSEQPYDVHRAYELMFRQFGAMQAENRRLRDGITALADEIVALNHGALRPSWVVDRCRALLHDPTDEGETA